ncbi:2,5-diketo-D-gluconic acid reductase B [Haloferax mucosum ATCC BAA-1512]|uniref:2,5-diketo-D-gluconic acid reductase B n=1 Tax=Haloferax mucosum ATCC BAA-1512 TaxID=662479 RepID=M0IN82_9EURY|nr:aldo/keto reductase [Haloferax mucosum]ELZ96924.1 2,5-diketo-D-gluconic acid reductase B [Haloferax mucosum ATCC BAA-1512]
MSVPRIGLGTMGLDTPEEATAVTTALELGYRHIDTAQIYDNECVVGDAVAAADVPREDVFLATKVWADSLAPDDVLRTTRESLDRLGTTYVDLLYVHRPIETYDPESTLAAFDELVDEGLTRAVGVSNFTVAELDDALDALDALDAPLVAHQTEYHPLFQRPELLDHAEQYGYDVVAYSPLAGGRVRDVSEVVAVAEKHDTTPEAVSLAWVAAKGLCPIPKASTESHLRANAEAVELELDESDMDAIDGIESEVELFPE